MATTISIQGILLRFIVAIALVTLTWNPGEYNFYRWAMANWVELKPVIVFVGLGVVGCLDCFPAGDNTVPRTHWHHIGVGSGGIHPMAHLGLRACRPGKSHDPVLGRFDSSLGDPCRRDVMVPFAPTNGWAN